jgi:uncharacterized protein (AIM24 family)
MNKLALLLIISILLFGHSASTQNVTITPSGITPALSGTYPRISYDDMLALPIPQTGDIAYDLTFMCLRVYNGTKWVCTYQNPADNSPNITAIITAGGTSVDASKSIAVDNDGNIFITGEFRETTNFETTSITSAGNSDIFVAKYNSSGILQWVQNAGGVSYDFSNDIAIDTDGNVFITGSFQGTASFGTVSKTSTGSNDTFLAKYNSSGILQWVQTAGGTSNDTSMGVTVDYDGNVLITGNFQRTASFGTVSKTSNGYNDIFVAKYSSSGILQWVQTAGGISYDGSSDIAVDTDGNVFITGSFQGTASFGTISRTSAGDNDMFVAKYDPVSISWSWVQTAGGGSVDIGDNIVVDAVGDVFITGNFQGTANFGTISRTSNGYNDTFVIRYSGSGTLQWVQTAGGTSPYFGNIAVDINGNVFITGGFIGTAKFGAISKTSLGFYHDIFVAKYNSFGSLQWIQTAAGPSNDYSDGIAVDSNGNIFITGYFQETTKFGPISKTSVGSTDIFVARVQE